MDRSGRSILIVLIIIMNIAISIMIQQEMLESMISIPTAIVSVAFVLSLLPGEKIEQNGKELESAVGKEIAECSAHDKATSETSAHATQTSPFFDSDTAGFVREEKNVEESYSHQRQRSTRDPERFFQSLADEKPEITEEGSKASEKTLVFSPMDNVFGQETEAIFAIDKQNLSEGIFEGADSADDFFAALPLDDTENDDVHLEKWTEENIDSEDKKWGLYEDGADNLKASSPMDDIFGQQVERGNLVQDWQPQVTGEEYLEEIELFTVSVASVGDVLRKTLADLSSDAGLISNVNWRTLFGVLGTGGVSANNDLDYLVVDNQLVPVLAVAVLDLFQFEAADSWERRFSQAGLPLLILLEGEDCSEREIRSFVTSNLRN